VKLKVGEALLFAPSAVVNLDVEDSGNLGLQKLGTESRRLESSHVGCVKTDQLKTGKGEEPEES
jgi:hypothetical protein